MTSAELTFDYLQYLKSNHPGIKLLSADNMPFIVSFLYRAFIHQNKRIILENDLITLLNDYLYSLEKELDENKFPKSAKAYLTDWADAKTPWLRKFYTKQSDQPHYDLLPGTEKAITWIISLSQREFVGTDSRLRLLFQLLEDLTQRSKTDAETQIKHLEAQRDKIDQQIQRIRAGQSIAYDDTQIKEQFFQIEDTARKLLSDFRQVEHNFRQLDRQMREKIINSDKNKGLILDDIFGEHDLIEHSDQGKSFRAFWEFLMNPHRQYQLDEMLLAIHAIDTIQSLSQNAFISNIKFFLLEAAENVYHTQSQIADQLRRFLDNKTYLENKRILDLINVFSKTAIKLEQTPKTRTFADLTQPKVSLDLLMTRRLFSPPKTLDINIKNITAGKATSNVDLLYQQHYVDEQKLKRQIKQALADKTQITLSELLKTFPIEKGLSEVVIYIKIASTSKTSLISNDKVDPVIIDVNQSLYHINLPQIIFTRSS